MNHTYTCTLGSLYGFLRLFNKYCDLMITWFTSTPNVIQRKKTVTCIIRAHRERTRSPQLQHGKAPAPAWQGICLPACQLAHWLLYCGKKKLSAISHHHHHIAKLSVYQNLKSSVEYEKPGFPGKCILHAARKCDHVHDELQLQKVGWQKKKAKAKFQWTIFPQLHEFSSKQVWFRHGWNDDA